MKEGIVNRQNAALPDVNYDTDRKAIEHELFMASIIIPVFNKSDLTKQCLTKLALVTEGVSYEVIVVDNASTDETPTFLSTLDGDIKIIRNTENLGFAKACNQGARVARGKHLVFLNNDTIPQLGWLTAMIEEVEGHSDVAVVGSKLLYPDNTIQHAGVAFCRQALLPYHIFNGAAENLPSVNIRRELQVVTAACMLVKPEIFEAVGGFDDGFLNGFEDVDFCLKIRERGQKVVYQPKSVLYHLEHQTPGRKDKDVENRNGLRFMNRWKDTIIPDEDMYYVSEGYKNTLYVKDGVWRTCLSKFVSEEEKAQWKYLEQVQRLLLRKKYSKWKKTSQEHKDELRALLSNAFQWPKDVEVLRWAAKVCKQNGFFESAWTFWTRMLELEEDGEAREHLATYALNQNDLSLATLHIQPLLKPEARGGIGYFLQGILFIQSQRYSQASESFRRAIGLGFDFGKAGKGLGLACLGMGNIDESWVVYAKVLAYYPDDEEVIKGLIQAGTALERWAELEQILIRYLERNPVGSDLRFALAAVEYRAGHFEKAMEQLTWLRLMTPEFKGLEDLERLLQAAQLQGNCIPTR